jgi:hypothetical protein
VGAEARRAPRGVEPASLEAAAEALDHEPAPLSSWSSSGCERQPRGRR